MNTTATCRKGKKDMFEMRSTVLSVCILKILEATGCLCGGFSTEVESKIGFLGGNIACAKKYLNEMY